jgi:hypothetical protein
VVDPREDAELVVGEGRAPRRLVVADEAVDLLQRGQGSGSSRRQSSGWITDAVPTRAASGTSPAADSATNRV